MEYMGMNHSPHYSRWTLKIKNPSLEKLYIKIKRSEACHNLKVLLFLQAFHFSYHVYDAIRKERYAELLKLVVYLKKLINSRTQVNKAPFVKVGKTDCERTELKSSSQCCSTLRPHNIRG